MKLSEQEIAQLYPGRIYIARQTSRAPIAWKLKPDSKALFVIHEEEYRNKNLTELLKKIVLSINLPAENAGFGVILREVRPEHLSDIPCSVAVVFDHALNPAQQNPYQSGNARIYFAPRLHLLEKSEADKRTLWGHLKEIKQILGM